MRRFSLAVVAVSAAVLLSLTGLAAPRTFIPDVTFTGSSLSGWHPVGQAEWKAKDGEIVGTPKDAAGGWIFIDRSYQDVGFVANFKCGAGCKTGVLFRAEEMPGGGMKGIYLSMTEGEVGAYRVTMDANGKELTRAKLGPASSKRGDPVTYMYGEWAAEPTFVPKLTSAPNVDLAPDIPASRPAGTLHKDGWNELEIIVDASQTKAILNEGPMAGTTGAAVSDAGNFGPIALFAGGTAEVRFKDVGYKDLNVKTVPKEVVSSRFRIQRLSQLYYAWTAAVADVNRDGIPDIITGPIYYLGPDYTTTREIYVAESYDPSSQYPRGCMVNFVYDFTGDGWPDEWCATGNNGNGPGVLYVNPRGEARRWDRYVVTPDVYIEESAFADLYGDGRPGIIMGVPGGTIVYARPDPNAPTKPWVLTPISEPGPWAANNSHGIGVGDINGDGRLDVVTAWGWWEQPAKGVKGTWKYHPVAFGRWASRRARRVERRWVSTT